MAIITKWKVINSLGDIKTQYFDTFAEAQTWVSTNGEIGHEYHYVQFSIIT